MRIYWRVYQILVANGDAQADKMLAGAYDYLQQRAAQVKDAAVRRSFLQDVPMHREMIAAFEQQSTKLADP